jgi:predicted Zn-dependent protease
MEMSLSRRFGHDTQSLLAVVAFTFLAIPLASVSRAQDDAQQLFRSANHLLDQGSFADAAGNYTRCLAADPHFVKALFNRALANEMVDRAKAIEDWKRFVEEAGGDDSFKWDVARAQARIQLLQNMPALPAGLAPSRYDSSAGDYYPLVAKESDGLQWRNFPVKVFLGSAPEIKWQQGTREAFNIWSGVLPLQLAVDPDRADIRVGWQESVEEAGHAGEETDWVRFESAGSQMAARRIAIIIVDLSRRWTKDEMRSIMLHEIGHALGIKGHSDSKKDILYWEMQEKIRAIPTPILPSPFFWRSLVKDPSARDMNTLIRLYNSAGYLRPLR